MVDGRRGVAEDGRCGDCCRAGGDDCGGYGAPASACPCAERGEQYESGAAVVDAPAFGERAPSAFFGWRIIVLCDGAEKSSLRAQTLLVFGEQFGRGRFRVSVASLFAEHEA